MRTLNRDKKPLYVCHRIKDSDPVQFEEPIKRYLNVVATSSEADIVALGESYKDHRRAKISSLEVNDYHEGDRVYLEVEPPKTHDKLCEGADFEIKSVSSSVSQTSILFKRYQIGK